MLSFRLVRNLFLALSEHLISSPPILGGDEGVVSGISFKTNLSSRHSSESLRGPLEEFISYGLLRGFGVPVREYAR